MLSRSFCIEFEKYNYIGVPWLILNKSFYLVIGELSLRKIPPFVLVLSSPVNKPLFPMKELLIYYQYRGFICKIEYLLKSLGEKIV